MSENFHRARVRENPLLAIVGNPPAKRRGGSEEFTFLAKEGQHFAVARVLLNIGLQPCVLSQREGYMVRAALPAGVTKESVGLALSRTGADRPLRRNPSRRGREVHPLAYEARDRYREDMGAGHSSAAEYWRGQAGAFFTGNPSDSAAVEKAKTELAESIRERKEHNKLKTPGRLKGDKRHGEWLKKARSIQSKESRREKVLNKLIGEGAGEEFFASIQWEDNPSHPYGPYWRSCACGRDYELGVSGVEEGCNDCMHYRGESPVAGLAGKKKIKGREGASKKRASKPRRKNPDDKRKNKPKTKVVSLEEGRKYSGFDQAVARYERFHGRKPKEVELYYLPDGNKKERVENVHVALHRTIETPYVVPWDSNKNGDVWLHKHPKGKDAPLEVLDPRTGTTRKIGGVYVVDDWWYS